MGRVYLASNGIHYTSSWIDNIRYDVSEQKLTVSYRGLVHHYEGVLESTFRAFYESDSVGSFYNTYIVGKYIRVVSEADDEVDDVDDDAALNPNDAISFKPGGIVHSETDETKPLRTYRVKFVIVDSRDVKHHVHVDVEALSDVDAEEKVKSFTSGPLSNILTFEVESSIRL